MRAPLIALLLLLPLAAAAQAPWGPPAPWSPPAWQGPPPGVVVQERMQCKLTCRGNLRMLCCTDGHDLSCQVKGPCGHPEPPRGPWGPAPW